jgi:uncharacterized protein YggE
MAITAAKEKAEMLTGAVGQSIGKAVRIIESSSRVGSRTYPNPFNASSEDYSNSPLSGESFSAGEISVTAHVDVAFALK